MHLSKTASLLSQDDIEMLIIDNDYAYATISLFGGHVLSFIPKHDNVQRLWLSKKAMLDGQHPIRGGIPICWPWFGAHASESGVPSHGYVRTQNWHVVDCADEPKQTVVRLKPSTTQGDGFAGETQLSLVLFIGRELRIQLVTENRGSEPLSYTCALHTYFKIDDINHCELYGLTGEYLDKLQDFKRFDTPTPYRFNQETDRVHLATPKTLSISSGAHQTCIESSGHDSIVVWNPWSEKSVSMQDMEDDGFEKMLCVETAVTQGQPVLPGDSHTLELVIR
jgi:glucose-6-phosphate 1-epimerase